LKNSSFTERRGANVPTSDELQQIIRSLAGLRYGAVNIVVQDGVVIQIERTEKQRLRTRAKTTHSPNASDS
jgi:hypothetical protein